jgi:hypothetical protein
VLSVGQCHLLFTVEERRRLTVNARMPAWMLPIFQVMLSGTLAVAVMQDLQGRQEFEVLCASLAVQGLGFLV